MTRGIGVGLLLVLSVVAFAQPQGSGGLAIRLQPSASTVELGTRLALDIEYEHTGTRAFFVERSNVLGPSGINIIARRDRCSYPVRGIVSDFGAERRQFRLIGLLPKDRMTERINEINGAGTEVPLPGPGAYAFHATFRSDGPVTSGTAGPIWRGASPRLRSRS